MDLFTRLADTLCFPDYSNKRTRYQFSNGSAAEGGVRSYALSRWSPPEEAWDPFTYSYISIHQGDILTVVREKYRPGYSLVINHRTNKTGLVPQSYVGTMLGMDPDGLPFTATAEYTLDDHRAMNLPGVVLEMQTGDTIRALMGDDVEERWGWGKNERTGMFGFFPLKNLGAKIGWIRLEESKKGKDD